MHFSQSEPDPLWDAYARICGLFGSRIQQYSAFWPMHGHTLGVPIYCGRLKSPWGDTNMGTNNDGGQGIDKVRSLLSAGCMVLSTPFGPCFGPIKKARFPALSDFFLVPKQVTLGSKHADHF